MTPIQHQELKDAIVRAVPKILEREERMFENFKYNLSQTPITSDWYNLASENEQQMIAQLFYESLPSQISLADVLLALNGSEGLYAIFTGGNFFKLHVDANLKVDGWKNTDIKWNLTLPLDEQEPEVLEWLHGVLVSKK
jgi:hypothetical protein